MTGPEQRVFAPGLPPEAPQEAVDLPRPYPLMPKVSRHRTSRRTLMRTVHVLDTIWIILCMLIALHWQDANWLSLPLIAVLPYFSAAILFLWGLWATHCYDADGAFRPARHMLKVLGGLICAWGAVALSIIPFSGYGYFGATVGIMGALVVYPVVLGHILLCAFMVQARSTGDLARTAVLIGATEEARDVVAELSQDSDLRVVGIFDDRADRAPAHILGVPVLGNLDDMMHWPSLPHIDQIIVSVPTTAEGRVRDLISRLSLLPNPVTVLTNVHRLAREGAQIEQLGGLSMAYVSGTPHTEAWALAKRAQDLVIGTLALVLLAPVMLIAAIAIKLESPGPVIFRQKRQGFRNQEITVYKFRSMHTHRTDSAGAQQVRAGDDRITKVGCIIRKTSIDELPQIFNVLRGEMSLVGPRPHALGMTADNQEVHRILASYAHRHRVKPGITGWAQINGSRGACDTREAVERRVAYDLEYIARAGFWFDLWIMLLTVPCFLGDRQAVR